jgi:hypothetical protein
MEELRKFQKEVHQTARSKGWWENPTSFGTRIALLKSVADALGSPEHVQISFYRQSSVARVDGRGELAEAFGVLSLIKDGDQSGFELAEVG